MNRKYTYEPNLKIFPTNTRINEINKEIEKIRKELQEKIKILEKEKKDIQDKCDHFYHMTSLGIYYDSYECEYCGHETEI